MGYWHKHFRQDESGQVAVIFALLAVPLLAVTSAAVDYTSIVNEKQSIKGALDAAVLAAVNNNAIPLDQKGEYANSVFKANYDGSVRLKLDPKVEENTVALTALGEIELSFGQLIGIKNPKVQSRSAATIANENTVCLMALNETAAQSISFNGGISYSSPSCSVYSNSSSASAIVATNAQKPEAKSFCAVGGAFGEFSPYAKGECKTLEDPYESTPLPKIQDTCTVPLKELVVLKAGVKPVNSIQLLDLQQRLFSAYSVLQETRSLAAAVEDFFSYEIIPVFDDDANRNLQVSENRTGSDVDIKPGTFCGGLTIDGINVDFLPGEYVIKDGPLSFINGTEAVADGVTFVLAGKGSTLNIQSKAHLKLRAQTEGARKGLAVMQAIDHSAPGNRPVDEDISLIAGGGSLRVLGTIYLPQQTLEIRGQGTSVGSMAPATSFIADKIHVDGSAGAKMVVDVDHVKAGVPPIQPRAEDGARLIE